MPNPFHSAQRGPQQHFAVCRLQYFEAPPAASAANAARDCPSADIPAARVSLSFAPERRKAPPKAAAVSSSQALTLRGAAAPLPGAALLKAFRQARK